MTVTVQVLERRKEDELRGKGKYEFVQLPAAGDRLTAFLLKVVSAIFASFRYASISVRRACTIDMAAKHSRNFPTVNGNNPIVALV